MALPFWLLALGRGAASATGTRGAARGAAKILKKGPKWDYDKVEGWQRPMWQRPTPTGATGARGAGGRFVGGNPKLQPGWINRMYMNPTTGVGTTARLAGLGVGGAVGADRFASMMRGDEASPDATAPVGAGSYTPSPSPSMPAELESRLAFEQRKSKKMNKQMKKLLQYYGIVNLVNPDSASDMLKIGTAMLEQDMGQMGTDRQAKIFDAIFKSGSMPSSGAAAAKMILNAGGTPEDVADITDIYESITPKAADLAEDERATAAYYEAKSYVDAGLDSMAEQILKASILSGQIARDSLPSGVEMPIEEQVQSIIQMMGGTPGMMDNSQGIKIL